MLSLRHKFSKGVVVLDHFGLGFGLLRKLRIWTYVQKGKESIFNFAAKAVCDKRWSPS